MKTFERLLPGLVLLWIAGAFLAVLGVEGDVGAWAWWLGIGVVVYGMALMAGVAACWRKETGNKPVIALKERKKIKMTYREMLQRDHPRKCGGRFIGGCQGCPGDYYPGAPLEDELGCFYASSADEYQCERCWDQPAK